MENNAIWIINDDGDDHELITDVITELNLKHDLLFFHSGSDLIQQLKKESEAPFLIMCDVNLPGLNGFQVREQLLKSSDAKFHSVPFIFWSTVASDEQIARAFRLRAHGFFIKEPEYKKWKESLGLIIRYWSVSKMPSKKEAYDRPMTIE